MDNFTWGLIALVVALLCFLVWSCERNYKAKAAHREGMRKDCDLMAYAAWYIRKGQAKPALAERLEVGARAKAAELSGFPLLPTDSCVFNGVVFGEEVAEGVITCEKIRADSITVGNIRTQP